MPPADENALYNVIERVSALLEVCPEIAELDINPVKVLAQGASAVDVRVRVEKERPRSRSRRGYWSSSPEIIREPQLVARGRLQTGSLAGSVKQSFPIRTLSLNEVGFRFRQKLDRHREPLGFAVRCRAPRHVDLIGCFSVPHPIFPDRSSRYVMNSTCAMVGARATMGPSDVVTWNTTARPEHSMF